MSATPRRDGEATRQKLLRAALELYTAAGFRDTTTPAIAARAGVAEGTIYRHDEPRLHGELVEAIQASDVSRPHSVIQIPAQVIF